MTTELKTRFQSLLSVKKVGNGEERVYGLFSNKQRVLFFIRKLQLDEILVYSKNIQEYLGIGKSYASNIIAELERERLIYRKVSGKWKRIYLTERGFKISKFNLIQLLSTVELEALQAHNLEKE